MLVAIDNSTIDNPSSTDDSRTFIDVDIKPAQLAEHIKQGQGYTAQHKLTNAKNRVFKKTGAITVDIPDEDSIEELRQDDFIQNYASILTIVEGHPYGQQGTRERFARVIFEIDKPIETIKDIKYAQSALVKLLGGDSEKSDPCHVFTGKSIDEPTVIGKQISLEVLQDIIQSNLNFDKSEETPSPKTLKCGNTVNVYEAPAELGNKQSRFSVRHDIFETPKPVKRRKKDMGETERYLILGFDTEYKTPDYMVTAEQIKAGMAKYRVLSYQFHAKMNTGEEWQGMLMTLLFYFLISDVVTVSYRHWNGRMCD